MKLRDYQIETINETVEAFQSKDRQMIVLPTGAGKTVVFSHIIEKMKLKTLIIAHTKELIEQAKKTCGSIIKSCSFEVMTIQRACISSNIDKLKNAGFKFLIVDECHRAGATTYLKLIDALGQIKVLGVTATPFRNDGTKLSKIFSIPTASLNILDLIGKGYLCDFEGYRVKTNCSLDGVKTNNGDFTNRQLASIINVKNRNALIVKEFTKICPKLKTLCFTANISHASDLALEFRNNGYRCQAIHGELGVRSRQKMISDFKSGEIQILINCQILTEGFDEPSIECLLMARPTISKTLYIQMIGRGSRTFPGKEVCKVIEFTDNSYDVCSIEDIIDAPDKKYKIDHGEKLSVFGTRLKKELENEVKDTIVEKFTITYKSQFDKPASIWQRNYLISKKIKFTEPLSEFIANHLISGEANG